MTSEQKNLKRYVAISKYLSKHLRHQPERLGLELLPGGWVKVDELLAAADRFCHQKLKEDRYNI